MSNGKKSGMSPVSDLRMAASKGVARVLAAKNVQRIERRYRVVTLRKQGCSTHQIAEMLGMTDGLVRDDIKALLNFTIKEMAETADENRQLQIERLDGLLQQYYPLAEAGSLSAAAMVLAIETRRSKLLALDIPEVKKLDVSGIREYVGIDVGDV